MPKKEYPKYDSSDSGDEKCWERYSKKIKEMRESDEWHSFPLKKDSVLFKGSNAFGKPYDPRQCKVEFMTPERYLELAPPKQHIRACSLDYLTDAYKFGKIKLDPPHLEVGVEDCRVWSHEGRHRAEIAADIEMDSEEPLPVIVCYMPRYKLGKEFVSIDEAIEYSENENYDNALRLTEKHLIYPENCDIPDIKPQITVLGMEIPTESMSYERFMKRRSVGLN